MQTCFRTLRRNVECLSAMATRFHPTVGNRICLANRSIYELLRVAPEALRSCHARQLVPCVSLPNGALCHRSSLLHVLRRGCISVYPGHGQKGDPAWARKNIRQRVRRERKRHVKDSYLYHVLRQKGTSDHFPRKTTRPLPILFPILLLRRTPLRNNRITKSHPRVKTCRPINRLNMSLNNKGILIPRCLKRHLSNTTITRVSNHNRTITTRIRTSFLISTTNFNCLFRINITRTITKRKGSGITPNGPPMPLCRLLNGLRRKSITQRANLNTPNSSPFLTIRVRTLCLIVNRHLCVGMTGPNRAPRRGRIPRRTNLFLSRRNIDRNTRLLFHRVTPINLLRLGTMLPRKINTSSSAPPHLINRTRRKRNMCPRNINARPFLCPRMLIRVNSSLLNRFLMDRINTLLLLPGRNLRVIMGDRVLIMNKLNSLPFLGRHPRLPIRILRIFRSTILRRTSARRNITRLLNNSRVLFPRSTIMIINRPNKGLLRLAICLIYLNELTFHLTILPRIKDSRRLNSRYLIVPIGKSFRRSKNFPIPISRYKSLSMRQNHGHASLYFRGSGVFISGNDCLFLAGDCTGRNGTVGRGSLCHVCPVSRPMTI